MQPVVVWTKAEGVSGTCLVSYRIALAVLLALLFSGTVSAAAEVRANYSQAQGTNLIVQITIGAPPPRSLILVQRLPPGVQVLAAQPASQTNTGQGEAKWLLRDLVPGQYTIRMTLDRPVDAGAIFGEIRYLPAQGGKMQSLPVARP